MVGRYVQDLLAEGMYSNAVTPEVLRTKKQVNSMAESLRNGCKMLVTGNPIFDEEGNMKLPLTDGSYTFKILWKKSADDKGTPADKYMLQEALKATGIKVEVEEGAAQAWDEKISVIFASGDLPDAICGEMPNLINFTDQCTDLTDLFPQYCPFMNSFFEENPGKLYNDL